MLNKEKPKHRTWFIDLDGTIFKHNKYLENPKLIEKPLPNALEFMQKIPNEDAIIFTTGRAKCIRRHVVDSLKKAGIRFDHIIMGLPSGTRILINDEKPGGKRSAIAIIVARDGKHSEYGYHKLSRKLYGLIDRDEV
jgi:hypothetical protein